MYREKNLCRTDRQFQFLYHMNSLQVSMLGNVYKHENLKLRPAVILMA
jgi:hypothetical protein